MLKQNPEIGDVIRWSFPQDYGSYLAGRTYQAKVIFINDKQECAVYAEYGQDYIPIKSIEKNNEKNHRKIYWYS